jgi:predicted transcriptional regulator with HTH domain
MKKSDNSNAKVQKLQRKSLAEIYSEVKAQPTPAQVFISELARVTHREPITIRGWLYGTQRPDSLTQSVMADYFGVEVDSLFPDSKAM